MTASENLSRPIVHRIPEEGPVEGLLIQVRNDPAIYGKQVGAPGGPPPLVFVNLTRGAVPVSYAVLEPVDDTVPAPISPLHVPRILADRIETGSATVSG